MKGAKRFAIVTAILASLTACPSDDPGGLKPSCPKPSGLISIGEPIPADCQLERMNGGLLRLSDLKGKPAVINFWATWCTFCIDEMPAIEEATLPVRSRVAMIGADLLGVDGETRSAAQKFAKKTGVTYDLVYDRGGVLFGNFSGQLLLPVTIFVKPDGIVAYRQFGPLTVSTLTGLMTKHLGIR